MGTIQVPGRLSGRTYTVDIKGDTPSETEQARIRAMVEERENRYVQRFSERFGFDLPTPDDGTALGRGWEAGKAGAYSRLGTATEYLGRGLGLESLIGTGQSMRQAGDYEAFLESLRQPAPTTLEDVKAAEGFFPTLDAALTYAGEGVGQSGPEMLAPLAATAAGTIGGTVATGNPFTGGLIGLGAGAVTAFPSFFGGNIQRQEAEVAAGRQKEVDVTSAVVGAVGQSALNAIGDKLLLGGFLKPGQKWLTRSVIGAGEGAATEIPTEIAQQIIERKQAGLPLDNEEAIAEYVNAGILAGIMGGGIRGVTAGLGIGVERPQEEAPPAAPPAAPTATQPARPGVATVSGVRRVESGGVPVNTVVGLSDGATITLEGNATEADIARAVDQYNQSKAAAEAQGAPKVPKPTTNVEDIPEADTIPDSAYEAAMDPRINAGVSVDQDLAAARKIYDDAVAFALDLGTDPEKAKELAARQTVNYVDSLQEDTRKRLERFRSTMARVAAGPTRGVMPPDLPDSAYAQEFGERVQEELFAPPEAAPAAALDEYAARDKAEADAQAAAEAEARRAAELRALGRAQAETRPAAPPAPKPLTEEDVGALARAVLGRAQAETRPAAPPATSFGHSNNAARVTRALNAIREFSKTNPAAAQVLRDNPDSVNVEVVGGTADPARNSQDRKDLDLVIGEGYSEGNLRDPELGEALSKLQSFINDNSTLQGLRDMQAMMGDKLPGTPSIDISAMVRTALAEPKAETRPAATEGAQDDAEAAAPESEAMGAGVEGGGRGVELGGQPAGDVQPAEGAPASAEGGLGGGVSVPVGADTAAGAEPDTLSQGAAAPKVELPVLYRGVSRKDLSDEEKVTPREGYNVFVTSNPDVAASYSGAEGEVVPVQVDASEVIEFPVEVRRNPITGTEYENFDKVEFDKRAAKLKPGQVLVARNVQDMGPRLDTSVYAEGTEKRKSATSRADVYAIGRGTPVKKVALEATPAVGAEPDTLTQLEERLAAARARAAELRKKVPAGILERELIEGGVDPALAKRVENLQNVLNRQQIAANKARDAVPKKPTHPARPKKLAQYEEAVAKVNETRAQLAEAQARLGLAELKANMARAAVPKKPMTDKAKSAYTAYFNALQDADNIRQTLESERARRTPAPETPPALPTGLRGDILPELNVVYPSGGTAGLGRVVPPLKEPVNPEAPLTMLGRRKVLPPASMTRKVANDVRKAGIMKRLQQFFEQRATPALLRYTTAQGGINNPMTWKDFPDWVSMDDQSKVVQLLGRLSRKEREKYKFPASEVEPLSSDAEAAHVYFSKTIRPVDAIDLMLADLSVDYEIYEGSRRLGLTEIEHRDLMMGTGSEVANRALNWVRANLSPETNAEIDLILEKQAEKDAVTADWIGTEGTDRVATRREKRKAARKERARAVLQSILLTDPVASLDQDMHYSVKAALDVGDLRGALLSLSATTRSSELRMLAERFAYLVGTTRVRVIYPGDSRKYIGNVPNSIGMYVQLPPGVDPEYENTILIDGQLGMTNHVLMHEVAHAVTARLINDSPNHPTVRQLEELLDVLREKGPKPLEYDADGNPVYSDEFYGLTSVGEMVAEVYGRVAFGAVDSGLLDLMKRTRIETEPTPYAEDVPLNAWERFREIIGNFFRTVVGRPTKRYPRRTRIAFDENYTTARDEFHRLVDGLLSTAPQALPDSVLQDAVVNPMVARNVLNNAVNNAPQWSPAGAKRLGELMVSSVPKPLRRALLGLLQLDWFNDFAGKYFPQIAELKAVDDLRRGKYQRLIKAAAPVMERLINYAKKNPELYKKLVAIQGQATLSKVDPTRPVSDYAGDKEKTAEWYNLNRQLNVDGTGELRKLFKETRNVFAQFREEIKRVLKVRALEITNDEARANSLVARLLQKLDEENAIDPYFSLMRTGDHWLIYTAEDTTAEPVAVGPLGQMKRPTTQYVQAFTNPIARDRFRAKLEAARDANGDRIAWDIQSKRRPKNEYGRGGTASVALAQGALNIISGFGGAGASAAEQQRVDDAVNAIQELFVRLTPDHSAMKAFINRKGTRGFMGDITPLGVIDTPTDFVEALARKVEGLSHQLVNIEFGGKIQKLIESSGETYKKLQDSGELTEGEQAAVDAYHDEFVERAGLAKNPSVGALAQFTRGITFGWTLGFSIAAGLNNILQLGMVGMPELSGRYGAGAAKRELGFAMRVMANAGKTEKVLSFGPDGREVRELSSVDNFGSLGNYFEPVITVDPKTGEEVITQRLRTDKKIPAKLKDKLANMDVLAEVMANHGMGGASMSQEMLESERGWLQKINRWSAFPQHHAERFNRQAMIIAAYNLELGNIKGKISQEAKLAAAMKAIEISERVNGTIGASTAPRYAMGAFGSVVFMFKRFALHMTRYIINAIKGSLKKIEPGMSAAQIDEAKKERAVARYQLVGMLGATALFAGAQGLPFFSELMTLINLFFTDDDEERPEVIVQKFLGEPYYHGALNYLLGIDVASRISMSGLIFRENKIEKDQSIMYDAIEMFGGPAVGVFQNVERGVELINDGEFYRGVEAMSPSALKSVLKSFRFSTDGATTLRGDEVIPVTAADIVRQALGYMPVSYARAQERASGAKRLDEAIRSKKRKLLRKYNMAISQGDFSEAMDVLREMREFTRQHPEEAIMGETVNRSYRSFQQRSQEMISGVSLTDRARGQQYIDEFDQDTTLWADLSS